MKEQSEIRMPRKKQDPTDLSIEEMEAQLAQIESDRANLETALENRRAADLSAFAESIREQIAKHGYHADEVIPLLQKGRKRATAKRGNAQYARYADPDNPSQTYSRGPLPVWLREKMEAAGYDAADKAQREEFKANYLQQVA